MCEFRSYWPRKSVFFPMISVPDTVPRQCARQACEYSTRTQVPSPLSRCAPSNAMLRFGIDRVGRTTDERMRQSAIGRKRKRRSSLGNGFASIASDQDPLPRLTFDLNDVQHVFVGSLVGILEIPGFPLDGQPPQRDHDVTAIHPHGRIDANQLHLNRIDTNLRHDGR